MNVGKLIAMLQEFDPNLEVTILDGSNGGGEPRTINLTPHLVDDSTCNNYERDDIETQTGEFVTMGYGCY